MDLVSNIYKITESFLNKELYGLTSQIRRAAVSVPSNIAESTARSFKKEFIQFFT
jgi:four helix bundle protein